jgi:outer membrane protein OmpA-like peptidoglycan-associated protein
MISKLSFLFLMPLVMCAAPQLPAATATQEMAAQEAGSDYFATIEFNNGEASLTDSAKRNLNDLISKAKKDGRIDEVKVLAWSDSEFYGEKTKLSQADQTLAKKRADAIEDYLKNNRSVDDVDTYNMAKPAGTLSQFFKTTESKLKNELASANNNASKALVMVSLKK